MFIGNSLLPFHTYIKNKLNKLSKNYLEVRGLENFFDNPRRDSIHLTTHISFQVAAPGFHL